MVNGYWKIVIGYWVAENDAHTNQPNNKPINQPFNLSIYQPINQ
jgi:hypothetical protein